MIDRRCYRLRLYRWLESLCWNGNATTEEETAPAIRPSRDPWQRKSYQRAGSAAAGGRRL